METKVKNNMQILMGAGLKPNYKEWKPDVNGALNIMRKVSKA